MKKIIFVHGIGNTESNYYEEWEKTIRSNHANANFTVEHIYWENLSDEFFANYSFENTGKILQKIFKVDLLDSILTGESSKLVHDYVFDFIALAVNPDFRIRLIEHVMAQLRPKMTRETIIIGHSLGAALVPQALNRMYVKYGSVKRFKGLILTASPLGICTPLPFLSEDMLDILYEVSHDPDGIIDRSQRKKFALREFASTMEGACESFSFFVNPMDIVCSDPLYNIDTSIITDNLVKKLVKKYTGPESQNVVIEESISEILEDVKVRIPVLPLIKQELNSTAKAIIIAYGGKFYHVDPVGEELENIGSNHDIKTYFNSPAFIKVLGGLL